MALYHVTIAGRDRRHMTELGTRYRVLVVGYRELAAGGVEVDAYVDSSRIKWLEKRGYPVTRIEEVEHRARQRQDEGRNAAARRLQHGRYGDVAWAGGYLTADEIERAMDLGVEQFHKGYVERIPLPNRTWEKRRCHALADRQGPRTSAARDLLHRRGARTRVGQRRHPRSTSPVRLLRAYRDNAWASASASRRYTAERRSGRSSRRRTCSCCPR